MFAHSKSSRKHIELPSLTKDDFITAYAQQRPFREGGNRLEKIISKGKIIVHNYGHGGAGVSLAPGSAVEAVRLA
jgi:D-amino-acid oxidase